mgnify:CR=1 FL=1
MVYGLVVKYDSLIQKKRRLDESRPFSPEVLHNLERWFLIELTYTSNALEGNTLTRLETAVVVEGGIGVRRRNRGQCAFSFIFLKTNSWQVDCGWDLREKGQSHILTYFKLREPSSDGTSAVRHLKILLSESTNCPPCK